MMVVRYFLGMALQQEATTNQQNNQPTSKPTDLMFVQKPSPASKKPANQQMNKQASKHANKQTKATTQTSEHHRQQIIN